MTADPNPQGASEPIARELMRQAQLISQLRHDVDELAHSTTDIAADLLSQIEQLGTTEGHSPSVRAWTWKDIGPEAEKELWSQLRPWIAWLRSRYPLAKRIPQCWDQHPEIVEELTALWLAWQAAYADANASLTAAADWHDRWLPGLLHRLGHGPMAIDCADTHRNRPARSYFAADA